MKNKHWFLAAGMTLMGVAAFAQKPAETSAAVEFKNNFQPAFMSQDMEKAGTSLLKAKGFIDQAAEHADTKESPKTLYYKGEIYFYLALFSGIDSVKFGQYDGDETLNSSIAAFNKGYTVSNKMDDDIEQAIAQKKSFIEMASVQAYNNKMYKEAMEGYDVQVKLSSAINKLDSNSIYFAGICAENAGDWDKAAEYYKRCAEIGYKVPEIYKTVANALIQGKKTEEATAFLAKAIEKAPNDKELHYVIGTFYMDAGENDKATESLKKAIAIDPKYWDAQYQLGAHYLGMATTSKKKANDLPMKDPNYQKLLDESVAHYKEAVAPLEAYIAANPKDEAVLTSLYQIYRALKNPEKEAEYKKRLDDVKAGR